MEDFFKPKIVWAELARTGNAFAVDFTKYTVGNTGYILSVNNVDSDTLYYLLAFLNSRIILYCLDQLCTRFDDNGWRWLRQFVEQLRIPKNINTDIVSVAKTTNRENQSVNSGRLNNMVAKAYGLNKDEIDYINNSLGNY